MKYLKLILFPFALIHALVLHFRHKAYDWNLFRSTVSDLPTVVVGNISMGGTGKSPMIEKLVGYYKDKKNVVLVSRGYKKQLSGIVEVQTSHTPVEIGDEPFMIKDKFRDVPFFVGSDRVEVIKTILEKYPSTDLILLDDALQHRKLKPWVTICLSDYTRPFNKDLLFPLGYLRDLKNRALSSDIIVETKRPEHALFNDYKHENVFLSSLSYGQMYNAFMPQSKLVRIPDNMIAVCGIANPKVFFAGVRSFGVKIHELSFADHYDFKEKDVQKFREYPIKDFVCTEKDAVKLKIYRKEFEKAGIRLWVLPIQMDIPNFDDLITLIDQKIENGKPVG